MDQYPERGRWLYELLRAALDRGDMGTAIILTNTIGQSRECNPNDEEPGHPREGE